MEAARVVVVGSANADLVARVDRLPGPGETVLGSGPAVHPGGKGANQAVAAARLGARVAMVGRVGADPYGELLVAALERDGVDTSAVLRDSGPTGVALITVDGRGENTIVVAPGANALLTAGEVSRAVRGVSGARVVAAQLEIPPDAVVAAAREAEGSGARFVLNAAPPEPLGDQDIARALLPLCDPLVVNEHEARVLGGGSAGDPVPGLLALGVRSVVVTLGERGAVLAEARGAAHAGSPTTVPGVPVKAVDTTGAGDAFAGALAWRLAVGSDLAGAVRWAVRAGAAAVRGHGAQSAYPRVDELP